MKKLRFISLIIVLLLFFPFIKQCDGITRKTEETPVADSTAVIIDSISEIKVKNEPLIEIENIQPNELNTYFTEESQNVFELSFQITSFFENTKKEDIKYKTEEIAHFCSILFSSLLIISSIIGAARIFRNRLTKTKWLYILNTVFIILIVISNLFLFLDRFGQIKIGFYLLLLTNFYMFYQLKQTSQKQDLIEN